MNSIFWALLVFFLVAAFLRMDWAYYLVYLVGGVWVASHVWMRWSLGRIDVTRRMPERVFSGETVTAELQLANRTWLPLPWLQIQDGVPTELKEDEAYRGVVSLGSRSAYTHRYQLFCRRRGYYAVGPLILRSSDPFGFVEARWEERRPARLIVYPQVLPLEMLGLSTRSVSGSLASRQRLVEDPARMAGVRAYASGDSLRHVHWKNTAHENMLLVKKFQPSQDVPVMVLLDLNRAAYPLRQMVSASEWAIVVAASVANAMTQQRQAVGLATNGLDPLSGSVAAPLPLRAGQEQLMNILSLLARVQTRDDAGSLAEWLSTAAVDQPWGTTLLLVAPAVDQQTLWALHEAYRRGCNVVVLLIARQPDEAALQAQGQRLGMRIHGVHWQSDLQALAASAATAIDRRVPQAARG